MTAWHCRLIRSILVCKCRKCCARVMKVVQRAQSINPIRGLLGRVLDKDLSAKQQDLS